MSGFFGSLGSVATILSSLKEIFSFIGSLIKKAKDFYINKKYKDGIEDINDAAAKAKEGSLQDRLKGGQKVENNFNKHFDD